MLSGKEKRYLRSLANTIDPVVQVGKASVNESVLFSLNEALDALEADHDYLTAGGVFPEELLANFIKTKRAECAELSQIPHPAEFEKYYNL